MKKVLFIFLCVFLSLFTLCSLLFLPAKSKENKGEAASLLIWHIDGFEGGVGSRLSVLKKIANEYMKNANVVMLVNAQTVNSAEENFKKGIYPDLISYSNGLNVPYDRLLSMPYEKDFEYAKPWCSGGYLIISRANERYENLIISQQLYTIPLLALNLSNVKAPIKSVTSSDKAIYEFYANKKSALLGTQRDLFRLQNKGISVEITPLRGFNDLYQYISVISSDKNYENCINFLNFLFTKCNQKGVINKIGMLTGKGYERELCDVVLSPFGGVKYEYVTYPLINRYTVEKLQKQALNFQKEEESIKNALKRLK